jgi:hypothetical protein
MKFAFHKERVTLFEKLCTWKMEGPYSHVEALFGPDPVNPSLTVCASSKYTEGGVRITSLDFSDTSLWDIIDVPGIDEGKALQWFKDHAGEPYNTRGLFQFITMFPVGNTKNAWFCDQACLAAIGMTDSYRFDPNGMYDILVFLKNYQAGDVVTPTVTIATGELASVPEPVAPLTKIEDEVKDKLKEALPVAEDIAQAAEVAAPIIALVPGGTAAAGVIGVVAPVIDKIAAAAPTVGVAVTATEHFIK